MEKHLLVTKYRIYIYIHILNFTSLEEDQLRPKNSRSESVGLFVEASPGYFVCLRWQQNLPRLQSRDPADAPINIFTL